jgi:subtilase family serine protease
MLDLNRDDALRARFSMRSGVLVFSFIAAAGAASLGAGVDAAFGQSSQPAAGHSGLLPLPGHVHRLAQSRFDAGEAPSSLRMGALDLVMAKTAQQGEALSRLIADQQNPKSAHYHHWLTPSQYGARFGATDATVATLSNWLKSNGLSVGEVPAGRGHLPFSGSKAQIEAAFRISIHLFDVQGERHYSNVSEPMIPASFMSLVAAVRGLNDFYPKPGVKPLRPVPRGTLSPLGANAAPSASPDTFYPGSNQFPGYVGPTDFATIYNFLPAYQQGITGAGVTVAIAAQSDINAGILITFWAAFGVSGSNFGLQAQQFSSIPVPAADRGVDPGQTNDSNEDEAYLDTEIVGSLAPGAQLLLVRDKSAAIAAEYVIDQNLAAILNVSFGQCESDEAAANTAIDALWEQAVSEGITITVSSGDAGVASCTASSDLGHANDVNTNGFAVNGLASTPYDLAVGGTDFNPFSESQYWSTSNVAGTLESAFSHIPEMVWNDSCANPVLADYFNVGDPIVFCNTAHLPGTSTANPFILISGAGGGLSSCSATGNAGVCTGGYPQPSWQSGVLGIGNFGARAIPDVSMIATRWLICSYDTTPCDPTQPPTFPPAATGTIKVLEGTSAAAPAVAAILALADQTQITAAQKDGRQGLVNPALYGAAAAEYNSAALLTACNASQGAISNTACIFYDITAGSNAQPCSVANYAANAAGSMPASVCGNDTGDATGIMEAGAAQDYVAARGFDIATGLGSINAAGLIAAFAPRGLTVSASGQTATLTWTADPNATQGYDIYEGPASGGVSLTPIQQKVTGTSTTVTGLSFGQSYVFAIAAVSAGGVSPVSSQAQVTIVPAPPAGLKVVVSADDSLSLNWTASNGANVYNIFEGSASGAEGAKPLLSGWGSTSYPLNGLTPGRQYFFTVTATNAGGSSSPSAQAGVTVPPAVPSGLVAAAGNGMVSLTWSAAAGAASYDVYEGTSSNGESPQPVKTGITSQSITISGLTAGKAYFFVVAAVNAGGVSGHSTQATATPTAPPSTGGGGGTMDWLALSLLASLRFLRSRRANGPFVRELSRESPSSRRTPAVGSARSLRSV